MGSYLTVVDWNNDTYHDLLVGDAGGNVTIFLNTNNNNSPILDSGTIIQAGGSDLSVSSRATPIVDDWNGDGAKDLLIGNWDGNINIYLNDTSAGGTDAAPVFNSSSLLQVGGADFDISPETAGGRAAPRIYDWNHDGLKDLLVGEVFGYVYYLENVGTNSAPVFDSAEKFLLDNGDPLKYAYDPNNPSAGAPRSRLFVTDWNEDGRDDIIVGGADGKLELYISIVSSIEMSVQSASIKFKKRDHTQAKVKLKAYISPVMPEPEDMIEVVIDGVSLFSAPFMEFMIEGEDDSDEDSDEDGDDDCDDLGRYELKRKHLKVEVDMNKGHLEVSIKKVELSILDNTNGVDVELYIGNAVAVENIIMEEHGKKLKYKRDDD